MTLVHFNNPLTVRASTVMLTCYMERLPPLRQLGLCHLMLPCDGFVRANMVQINTRQRRITCVRMEE